MLYNPPPLQSTTLATLLAMSSSMQSQVYEDFQRALIELKSLVSTRLHMQTGMAAMHDFDALLWSRISRLEDITTESSVAAADGGGVAALSILGRIRGDLVAVTDDLGDTDGLIDNVVQLTRINDEKLLQV